MSELLSIVVDDRERVSPVPALLVKDPRVKLSEARLDIGDYEIAGSAVIERKTVADFARSIVDGRLFRQASRLASHTLPAVVVIEGAWRVDGTIEGVDRRAVQGALVSLGAIFRLPVLYAADARETAELIRYAADQLRRVASGVVPRPGYRPKGKRKRQLFILQGLPGIGAGRAARLLDRFGSVENVFQARERELADVPGIGHRTAQAIRAVVQEAASAYPNSRA